ncbi:MAG: type I glutamate--ammonia ligase [Phototrophicales bacterium]|nr:MAG: type I glutamate--ammonia ligase [Phototrophicales bacterium]RMG76918.1 MAG: type I glutamate--ammonia ligase [Chloroflexota bacterium]
MGEFTLPASAKESPEALLKWAKENGVEEVDIRFTDLKSVVHHFSMPLGVLDVDVFEDGFGFDGSSVRGFQAINESDLILKADLSTAHIEPFFARKTLAFLCDVYDPITREPYGRDPRGVARRAEEYLKSTGIADTAFFGPEAEFFLFSNVSYDVQSYKSFYQLDSHEGFWNSGSNDPSMVYLNRIKEGYFPLPPLDKTHDVRADMVNTMINCGIEVEVHHHEVGGGGQAEIDMKFDTLLKMADKLLMYKHIVKNVAARNGLVATFMPKPLFEDNGSGMHVHQSLWKDGNTLFYGDEYANLSELALYYIGGILKHAVALMAFTNPTTNSYRRLVPGYEAPVNLVYSNRNRSAAIRIPVYVNSPKAKRIETRFPDPTANPYYAFPALMMAGLDGIRNKIHPGQPMDIDLYSNKVETPTVPHGGLNAVLDALEADHEFLLEGGVFTEDIIKSYIAYKREEEADPVGMRPHPYEFQLYFDI